MAKFIIDGGHPLKGRIRSSGNKNAALPILCASILADSPVWIRNIPKIGDVATLLLLLESMGVRLAWQGDYDLRPDPSGLVDKPLDPDLCRKVRGSVLLAAPLLHRFGRVELPFPGGDKIGRRRIDTHIMALEQMGATFESRPSGLIITAENGLAGADILLDEASVTATENAVMAACLAHGQSIIGNAACEPHVQELCRFLNLLGADISGIGTNRITVNGVPSLSRAGCNEVTLGADYLEVASLMAITVITRGEVTIEEVKGEDLRMILYQFRRLGMTAELKGDDLFVPAGQPRRIQTDFRGAVPTVASSPWPAFPADLTSIALVAATQMEGSVMIHEKMFESRLFFVDQLLDMGAQVVLCDPHRAVVAGSARLSGSHMHSPDIRAGMALLAAALAARGQSVIENVSQIERGYEAIDTRLRRLGAHIETAGE